MFAINLSHMEELILKFADYGLSGLGFGVMIFFIYRMQTIYQEERREWKDAMVSQNEQFVDITSRQHDQLIQVVRDTHTILAEIKSLIQFKN